MKTSEKVDFFEKMIVLGSRGVVHEQIVPEIYTRVFEVLMRYSLYRTGTQIGY